MRRSRSTWFMVQTCVRCWDVPALHALQWISPRRGSLFEGASLGVVGIEGERLEELRFRLGHLSVAREFVGEGGVGIGVAGMAPQGIAKALDGAGSIAGAGSRQSEVEVSLSEIGLELGGFLEGVSCIEPTGLAIQRHAELHPSVGRLRLDLQKLFQRGLRFVATTLLDSDSAEQEQGLGIVGSAGQKVGQSVLGLSHAPLLKELVCLFGKTTSILSQALDFTEKGIWPIEWLGHPGGGA